MANLPLEARRLLVVEDEYLIASDLLYSLECAGARVYGPVSDLERAIEVMQEIEPKFDAAVLDINLHGEQVFPAASLLKRGHIPFVFVTGYECSSIPDEFMDAPCLGKPFDDKVLIGLLARLTKNTPHRYEDAARSASPQEAQDRPIS